MSVYCQKCQTATAVVHVTELKGDKKYELHLCEECAEASEQVPKASQSSMLEFLQQFMESATRLRDRQCPECGMTFTEFKAKGRFGCAHDYDVFLSRLLPLLERMHESSEHTESVAGLPAVSAPEPVTAPPAEGELARLRRELKRAVDQEQYEKAAALRDKIRELERGEPDA